MPFIYHRTVRFADTDAAGVVYFANALSICHEAYEASLAAAEIDLKQFFKNSVIALPITHADINFFRPMYCGDRLAVYLSPQQSSDHKFEISYQITSAETDQQVLSKATTMHVCIDPTSRSKIALPNHLLQWLQQWS